MSRVRNEALGRHLSLWQLREKSNAEEKEGQIGGLGVAVGSPAYTKQTRSRCGLLEIQRPHVFWCPPAGMKPMPMSILNITSASPLLSP
jgi:transposase